MGMIWHENCFMTDMKKNNLSFLVLSSLFCLPAFSMTDAELAHELRKDIDQYIITLKSPKLAFHWVDASDVNPPKQYDVQYPATAPLYRAYVDKAGSAIYNKLSDKAYDIAGPGLYMSSHPSYSRSYGGKKRFG